MEQQNLSNQDDQSKPTLVDMQIFQKGQSKNGGKILVILILITTISMAIYFFLFAKEDNVEPVTDNKPVVFDDGIKINKVSDRDNDGLPDYIEEMLGTNSNEADTDGDSYTDLDEIKNGYNPLTPDKYTGEEWQAVKNKIKIANAKLYGKEFGITDETSDWRTYKNEQYGFEIKYPNNWETTENATAVIGFAKTNTKEEGLNRESKQEAIQIKVADRKTEVSFVEQIGEQSNVTPKLVRINDKDFYYTRNLSAGLMFYEYNLEYKDKIFTIFLLAESELSKDVENEDNIACPTDINLINKLDVLYKMVFTFKFIVAGEKPLLAP